MTNWRVMVQTDTGQIKEVYIRDFNSPDDASRAALAQTGAQRVVNCFIDWSSPNQTNEKGTRINSDDKSARAVSSMSREISDLSDEVAELRQQIQENNWKDKAQAGFKNMWKMENERAEEEGRPLLSYNEAKLIWGDPLDLNFLALYERSRSGNRVVIECPLCSISLRIPDGKRGIISCPTCLEDFYVDATHEYVARPDLDIVSQVSTDASVSKCFIATVAFGSKDDKSVVILRRWRDKCLLSSSTGRRVCQLYLELSPPIAEWVGGSNFRRRLVRLCLVPIVAYASLRVCRKTMP